MKHLSELLSSSEDGKLDFKESYGFMLEKPDNIGKTEWLKYVDGQWDEFCKDVIALSNGDLSSEAVSAFIILGVSEINSERYIKGVQDLKLDRDMMIKKLNSACSPAVPDIIIHRNYLGGDICALEIPFIPQIIESKRNFLVYSIKIEAGMKIAKEKVKYSKHSVFYRSGETTEIASLKEKDILAYKKSRTGKFIIQAINDEINRNLKALLYKNQKGHIISPVYGFEKLQDSFEFSFDGEVAVDSQSRSLMIVYAMQMSSFTKDYDHTFLEKIYNDIEFRRYIDITYENVSVFYAAFYQLKKRMLQLISSRNMIMDHISKVSSAQELGENFKLLDATTVIILSTNLARASDICKIYLAIVLFFDHKYDYLLNMKLSPYFLSKDEKNPDGDNILQEEITSFVISEINRQTR